MAGIPAGFFRDPDGIANPGRDYPGKSLKPGIPAVPYREKIAWLGISQSGIPVVANREKINPGFSDRDSKKKKICKTEVSQTGHQCHRDRRTDDQWENSIPLQL